MSQLPGALTRPVVLRIPHDHHEGGTDTDAELIARSTCTEGALLLDDSGRRQAVRVCAGPTLYEMTVLLKPGWLPDSAWDVNPDDATAVANAIAATDTDEWAAEYVKGLETQSGRLSALVGRYWVLNEDGAFTVEDYRRSAGPWSFASDWWPYDFARAALVADLANRPDCWSTRRRRFILPEAVLGNDPKDPRRAELAGFGISVSFQGDNGPWYWYAVTREVVEHRCAILIQDEDLRRIWPDDEDDNFVAAYIKGLLRIRVTALIEGDDQIYGYAGPSSECPLPWVDFIDRRGHFHRHLRSGANSNYWNALSLRQPDDRDDTLQMDALAERMLAEFSIRRVSGQASLPYLVQWRPDAAWDSFLVGDEIRYVYTEDGRTGMALQTGQEDNRRAPRINSIMRRYSKEPPELTTSLTLEDETYGPDDVLGPRLDARPGTGGGGQ